ncbi:phage holin family protein [Morganella sp. GD04133]|nr:phage holin family protein [Morganella sp. GD04133]MDH0355010.1 phage holin family protein [Morganella sp. GD04133]
MRMPDKIDWWEQIFRWLQNALPFIGGFSFSAAMAYIRERRLGTRWRQSLGEAIMCGLLSVGTIRLIDWWFSRSGDAESWAVLAEFSGVMIGFLGTKKVYALLEWGMRVVKNRFGAKQ